MKSTSAPAKFSGSLFIQVGLFPPFFKNAFNKENWRSENLNQNLFKNLEEEMNSLDIKEGNESANQVKIHELLKTFTHFLVKKPEFG